MRNLFSVENKIIVVTGGLGQLGVQFTQTLIDQGAKVAVFDIRVDAALVNARFGETANSDRVLFVPVDITHRLSLEAALKQVEQRWATPDGLINNAALDSPPNAPATENGPFETYSAESWDKVMQVNVRGLMHCCQVIGGAMAAVRRGSIINVCSIYGLVSPDQRIYEYRRAGGNHFYKPLAYSASKSALLNMTRYLATYWADRAVRVNTLSFGGVFNDQDDDFLEGYCFRVPLGRMAREDEYNGAVVFLLSDAASYMTGSNLIVDGGWTAW